MPLPIARPTRLVSRKGPNSSGKSVTTSICMTRAAALENAFGPRDPLARQPILPYVGVDPLDEVFDERKLDLPLRGAGLEAYDQHLRARVADEILDDAELAAR